jgi:pentose-5-phosphate-3-epimerase
VDGGINGEMAPWAVEAGANVVVEGLALFGDPQGIAAAIARLRVETGPKTE